MGCGKERQCALEDSYYHNVLGRGNEEIFWDKKFIFHVLNSQKFLWRILCLQDSPAQCIFYCFRINLLEALPWTLEPIMPYSLLTDANFRILVLISLIMKDPLVSSNIRLILSNILLLSFYLCLYLSTCLFSLLFLFVWEALDSMLTLYHAPGSFLDSYGSYRSLLTFCFCCHRRKILFLKNHWSFLLLQKNMD